MSASAGPDRRPPSTGAVVAALVAVTAVWGSTFVVVKDAIERMPVLAFLTWRFVLAALAMVVFRPRAVARLSRDGRRHGALLGVALGAGYLAQTFGLRTADAAVSGFITGMFVVFTPLAAAVLLRRAPGRSAWAAVVLATVGLGLLSLDGFQIGGGEALTLLCAVAFALHIVGLGEWSARHDAYALAVVQLAVVAAGCAIGAAAGGLSLPRDGSVWVALVVTALLATAVAFVVQTWAQAHLEPTRAAVIMTMEPVFAGVFAAVAGETFGARKLAGSALILAAMLAVEIGPRHGAEGDVPRLET
ncbi:MAG TPA: DMT family transporter [Mycobacteriales bacterium]|nr:DMT family transporter [Mycobacteriales bacterium]